MKPHPRQEEQDDLLRPRLTDMIDMRHELATLAALIDWEFFEREWAGFFPSHRGRPATSPRLVAGLLYLQHAYRLSDEAVVARWVENPYCQHFTGETFGGRSVHRTDLFPASLQHRPPIDPSCLTRWRQRIGEEGAEWLLTKTIEAGRHRARSMTTACRASPSTPRSWRKTSRTRPTRASMTRPAISLSPLQVKPGSRCGRTTTGWRRAWPCRPADTPMPDSSSACARP